jgi:plasmid stabilization system protein ParE
MKVNLSDSFFESLGEIISYIARDKPLAARKFKKELIIAIRKDLKFPYNYKKSIYFKINNYRDYVFKGYTITYKVDDFEGIVEVIGIIKNKKSY